MPKIKTKLTTVSALFFLTILAVTLPIATGQATSQGITVTLNQPQNNTATTQLTQLFNYTPTAINDTFNAACLYINGLPVAFNQTAIQNETLNSINYTFTGNGLYVWNVQVLNSTQGTSADSNYTLIVNSPPTVAPTLTPTATPNPSAGALDSSWLYITLLIITLFLSVSAFMIKDAYWSVSLKVAAGLFWFILAISQVFFFGVDSAFIVLSFPYAVFGLLFIVAIVKQTLNSRHDAIFNFD